MGRCTSFKVGHRPTTAFRKLNIHRVTSSSMSFAGTSGAVQAAGSQGMLPFCIGDLGVYVRMMLFRNAQLASCILFSPFFHADAF
jgi:hypothetical protein